MSTKRGKFSIDLTADKIPLQINTRFPIKTFGNDSETPDNRGIKFNLSPAMIEQLKDSQGFVPVIINIEPMTDLKLFLGISESSSNSPSAV